MDAEQNRNNRRDKKVDRKKAGMRVNRGAKMLANVIAQKYQKLAFYLPDKDDHWWNWNGWNAMRNGEQHRKIHESENKKMK